MKKIFALLAIMLFAVGNLCAQSTPLFNRAWDVYNKSYTASTANDTTQYFPLTQATHGRRSGTTDIRFFGRSNDSLSVNCYYQLKNSTTGSLGTWTQIDTVIHVATSDSVTSPGTLLLATLIGYDQIRFYFDWLAASAGGDGTADTFRWYLYLFKNEDN